MLASGGTQGFAAALTSALLPGAEGAANAPDAALPEGTVRQKAAGGGKDLPEGFGESAEDGDEKDEMPDAPFAWFGIPLAHPVPAPIAIKLALPVAVIPVPEGEVPAQAATPDAGTALTPALAQPGGDAAHPAFELAATLAEAPAPAAAPKRVDLAPVREIMAGVQTTATPRIELPSPRAPAAGIQPIAIATAQQPAPAPAQPLAVALQPLAAEIAPAGFRRQLRDTVTSTITALTPAEAPRALAVAATPDAQQPALDMRRQEWMGAMVEHIEALRDASPTRETNIRLAPDALGSVDIAIRHEGDRVHVRFTADNAAARTLLAEAQPRLNELAEARGLRLGQTSVDGGAAGQSNQRHAPAPQTAFAPASASASALRTETATPEDRIA